MPRGSAQSGGTTSGATSAATQATADGTKEPPPEPTGEEYLNFEEIKILDKYHYYVVSAKSTDNLPETLVIPGEYKGLQVRAIEGKSFSGSKIKKLVISEGVMMTPNSAFLGCKELEEVVIYGDNLGSFEVSDSTFEGCTNLKKVTFYCNVNLHNEVFKDCRSLITANAEAFLRIGSGAFENCESLRRLKIEEETEEISPLAFRGCTSLVMELDKESENFKLMDECLVDKKKRSLLFCRSHASIPRDGSVTHIESFYFLEQRNIVEYRLPNVITSIGEGAFTDCKSLKKVILTQNINSVPQNAFKGLENLESVEIMSAVTIGEGAFDGCTSLREVIFPANVDKLQSFNGCTSLSEINFPSRVRNLNLAFSDCNALEKVEIHENVARIIGSFQNCTALKSVTISHFLETFSYSFNGCTELTEINFSGGVGNLFETFNDCASLTEVTVPEGTARVTSSFNNCKSLTKITLPKSIETIDDSFAGNPYLFDVYYNGTKEEWSQVNAATFRGQLTVHCTDGDVELFNK